MKTKTVHRRKLYSNFTPLPNATLRNKTLSFKARGILCMMLSHSEQWEMTLKGLESLGTEGREAIRSAVHELESSGYATRRQSFNPDRTFAGVVWTWHSEPVAIGKRTSPSDGKPSDGLPSDGYPSAGLPSEIQKSNQEEDNGRESRVLKREKGVGGSGVGFNDDSGEYEW